MHVGDADSPQVIALPPLIFLGGILAGGVFEYFAPPSITFLWPYNLVGGFLLIAFALALAMRAARTFTKAGTNVDVRKPAHKIVSEGPFQYTRNPMYVSMALLTLGIALLFQSLWIALMLIPVLLVIRYGVIAREETYLEKKFGNEYLAYKSRVRRWV